MTGMWKMALRGLVARKTRLVMSVVAIVLGVGFVAGAQTLSTALHRAYTSMAAGSIPDVVVQDDTSQTSGSPMVPPKVHADTVLAVADLPEVARAEGEIRGTGLQLVDSDGVPVGGPGRVVEGVNFHDLPAGDGSPGMRISEGRAPGAVGEVAIDPVTAEAASLTVGRSITVVSPSGGSNPHRIVGLVESPAVGLQGTGLVAFETGVAQSVLAGESARFTSIGLLGAEGVSQEEVAAAVRPVVPEGLSVVTGDTLTLERVDLIDRELGFLTQILYGFAAVSVLVGCFLIVNTFGVFMAQRRSELALLRALGGSRLLVLGTVLLEAGVLGLIASIIGAAVGTGIAYLVVCVISSMGRPLPTNFVIDPTAVLLAVGVGVVSTVAAAWIPARSAARVAPVVAMNGMSPVRGPRRARLGTSLSCVVLGATLAVVGAGSTQMGWQSVVGIVLLLAGVIGLGPYLVRPFIALFSALDRMFGPVGQLARRNVVRNPRRTSATASAVMVGLMLVTAMTVVGQSVRTSIGGLVADSVGAELLVATPSNQALPKQVSQTAAEIPGVDAASGGMTVPVTVAGVTANLVAEDQPGMISAVSVVSGSLDELDAHGIAVASDRASELDLAIGDQVEVVSNDTAATVRVDAIYEPRPSVIGPWFADKDLVLALGWPDQDQLIGVSVRDDAQTDAVKDRLNESLTAFPMAAAYDQSSYAEMRTVQIDQLVKMVYGLLALTVLISVLGVVNTLALSVIERVRELQLLRAVGMHRASIRRMVHVESVLLAVFGGILGVVLGVAAGVLVQRGLRSTGVTIVTIPWGQLVLYITAAAFVGILAAAIPARRTGRVHPVEILKG